MESHSYEKQGEGVPPAAEIVAGPSEGRCEYIASGGRRCRMAVGSQSNFCSHHARVLAAEEPQITEATAQALLDGVDAFADADEVKLFLRNLVRQVIRQRVGRRDAAILAYLSQLMLNCEAITLSQMRDEDRREAAQALVKAKTKPPVEIIWDLPGPKRLPSDP